jgi:hypothetical protein
MESKASPLCIFCDNWAGNETVVCPECKSAWIQPLTANVYAEPKVKDWKTIAEEYEARRQKELEGGE